jgi:hypothetical protein
LLLTSLIASVVSNDIFSVSTYRNSKYMDSGT